MKTSVVVLFVGVAASATEAPADRVAGILLYPGASRAGVDGTEKMLRDSGYGTAVCLRTRDTLAKVVGFYKKQSGLQLVGEAGDDSATFMGSAPGTSVNVNSPWMDMKTLQMQKDTQICIVSRSSSQQGLVELPTPSNMRI